MLRQLNTIQKRENLNKVFSVDEKGPGGANHTYLVVSDKGCQIPIEQKIIFQKGPRKDENSIHGVVDQDLLEIVRDRLKGFQEGEFATEYNAKALEHLELALMYMNRRVEDRIERNVLGTYNK